MANKIKCTCGHSWNKSDSSKKDVTVCHICGKDNVMQKGGWLNKLIAENIYPYGGFSNTESEYKIDNFTQRDLSQQLKDKKINLKQYREKLAQNAYNKEGKKLSETWNRETSMPIPDPSNLNASYDALYIHQGLPQKYNSFVKSQYKPSTSKNSNSSYYSLSPSLEKEILEDLTNYGNKDFIKSNEQKRQVKGSLVAQAALKNFQYSKGKDEKGNYVAYYDVNDYDNPLDWIGNPFEIYGRIYIDPKTGKPKMKNGGWLDKYDAPKAQNGIEATMDGLTDQGFNYNGAWGGTMQMGGNLPGSVGFMYARTQNPAPSNGPYAKKTKASAQNGKEMKFYQEGLDWKPRNISRDGSEIPQAQMGTMATPLDFSKPLGTLEGVSEVMSAPARTATYLLTGKYQDPSQALGIKNPWGALAVDAVLDPVNLIGAGAVGKVGKAAKAAVKASKESGALSKAYKYNPWAFKVNEDNWYRQVGKSAIDDISETGLVREAGEEVSPRMWSEFQDQIKRLEGDDALSYEEKYKQQVLASRRPVSPFFAKGELFYPMGRKETITKSGKLSKNPAAKGNADYLIETALPNESFQPAYVKGMSPGVPTTIGQTAILKPNPSLRDLENFNLYKQHWLQGYKKVKPPKKKEEGGDIKKDDNGYWNPENWGEPVEIGSNNITMKGLQEMGYNKPLLGISDTGDVQYMEPGQDYKFKGNKVTEYPIAQEGIKTSANPYFKSAKERDAYRQRLKEVSEQALSVGSDEDLLIGTSYHNIDEGNNCINGICGLNRRAGITYNKPTDVDRFLSGEKFAQAVAKGDEDYYQVDGNFQIGDHMMYRKKKGTASHNKIIYDSFVNDQGEKVYKVIDNAGGKQMKTDNYTESELKKMQLEGGGGYDKVNIYRPGYSIDKTLIEKERLERTSPEARKALADRAERIAWETSNNPGYKYSIRKDSEYYNDQPEGMQKFIEFANDDKKINKLVEKLGVDKGIIHDELLNTFGELGQENKWEDRTFGGTGGIENTIEKIFKPKSWSIGPGQIKFNTIDPELKQKFNIKKPKDLYDFDKIIPLMTAMNIKNRKYMENQGKDLSTKLIGKPGVGADELEGGVGRWTPYMYRGKLSNPVSIANEEIAGSDLYGQELTDKRNSIIRDKASLFDKGSYASNVFENIDKNLERTLPGEYFYLPQEMQPIKITAKKKKKNGGWLEKYK